MNESQSLRRPYAAPANVKAVLARIRTRNLPDKIDDEFFRLVELSPIVFGRVKEALRFLRLIEEDGRPTDLLRALAAAPETDYRGLLASAIQAAYAEDFKRIDPAVDTQAQIVSAFQPYEPRSQTPRMVMLFLGLCREAGVPVLDAPRERKMQPRSAVRRSTRARLTPGSSRREQLPPGGHALTLVQQPGLLFGVSEDDIAALDESEFQEVWAALGKVARARARAKQAASQALADQGGEDTDDEGGEDQ